MNFVDAVEDLRGDEVYSIMSVVTNATVAAACQVVQLPAEIP